MVEHNELWIGLVELRPVDSRAFGSAGASTTIVTWATDADEFRRKAETVASTVDMFVLDVEKVEPLARRVARETLSEELQDIVFRVESNRDCIIFGTFYTYDQPTSN
jgi:hypothetical protein